MLNIKLNKMGKILDVTEQVLQQKVFGRDRMNEITDTICINKTISPLIVDRFYW